MARRVISPYGTAKKQKIKTVEQIWLESLEKEIENQYCNTEDYFYLLDKYGKEEDAEEDDD
jgi:hypothetical protein